VGTDEVDKNGDPIKDVYANLVSLDNISDAIDLLVAKISKQIDWEPFDTDSIPPYVDSVYPVDYIAKIHDPVEFVIKERLPSEGIDLSTLKVTANGIDITNEIDIKGNPYEYHLKWRPKFIVYDTYL
jgi:hypothetical protein